MRHSVVGRPLTREREVYKVRRVSGVLVITFHLVQHNLSRHSLPTIYKSFLQRSTMKVIITTAVLLAVTVLGRPLGSIPLDVNALTDKAGSGDVVCDLYAAVLRLCVPTRVVERITNWLGVFEERA